MAKPPAAEMNAENYDARFTLTCPLGAVTYDSVEGIGNHSENAEIRYRGFGGVLRTNSFLTAAARLERGERRERSLDYLPSVQPEPGWAPPRLVLDRIPPTKVGRHKVRFVVTGHEGRHRTLVSLRMGCLYVPVHVNVRGERARHITIDDIESMAAGVIIEDGGRYALNDPFLDMFVTKLNFKTVFLDGKRYDYEAE
jgi:hypothetical protein